MTARVGADFELQKAVVSLLAANADIQALLGSTPRIYQQVPDPNNATFPFITTGEGQQLPDLAECIDGREVFMTLHIWSRTASFAEAKSIAATIAYVIANNALSGMTENVCKLIEPDPLGDVSMRDPDGITKHIASHYRALCEPT